MTELHIDAPPSEVRARIQGALHSVNGLWFNTAEARKAWRSASSPLFVQWTGEASARIGPRLGSPDVSRFCPQWRLRIEASGGGSVVQVRGGLDALTAGLGVFWSIMLVLGGLFVTTQIRAGEIAPGAIGWWLFLVLAVVSVAAVSLIQGGRVLTEAEAWFEEVLRSPSIEEEWV